MTRSPYFAVLGTVLTSSLVIVTGLMPTQASGFGTINNLGQKAEHERITRAALACPAGTKSTGNCFEPISINQLAGRKRTFGAVGAPDFNEITNAAAHCDNADFLSKRGYPRKRAQATAQLTRCRNHLKRRFLQGLRRADDLLNDRERIISKQVNLGRACHDRRSGRLRLDRTRAKCKSIDGFGRMLHGAQDFYSHSNWSDSARKSKRISINNPPGLKNSGVAPILNMRASGTPSISHKLTTGCYSFKPRGCKKRIEHDTINKDKGTINPVTGATSKPKTKRGKVANNFQRAVSGAIAETRRQWRDFSSELIRKYGPKRGSLMICALTRDDPVKDCQGRDLAIVIDSSGSNEETDPANLRVAAGRSFNASLITAAEVGPDGRSDRSTVIDFDTGARVISPLGDPSASSFAGIDSFGGTNIGLGVNAALSELTKDPSVSCIDRCGIVVLTDGEDNSPGVLNSALSRASSLGIRVNFGFLSPPSNPVPPAGTATKNAETATHGVTSTPQATGPSASLVAAILQTGGFYATIDSAEAQNSFINLVISRGATNLDDPNGADDGGPLAFGVSVTGLLASPGDVDTWNYSTTKGQHLVIRASSLGGQVLQINASDVNKGTLLAKTTNTLPGEVTVGVWASSKGVLEFDLFAKEGTGGPYTVGLIDDAVRLNGTKQKDRLDCVSPTSTYVVARANNDKVTCNIGDDLIVGGRGADNLRGGGGNDIFLVSRRDLRRGTERIAGGEGIDEVQFSFKKPRSLRRQRCKGRKRITLRISRKARFRLSGIEKVTFRGKRC